MKANKLKIGDRVRINGYRPFTDIEGTITHGTPTMRVVDIETTDGRVLRRLASECQSIPAPPAPEARR